MSHQNQGVYSQLFDSPVFQESQDHNFVYIVIVCGMANMSQYEKRRMRR
jgi:hypothetical protein